MFRSEGDIQQNPAPSAVAQLARHPFKETLTAILDTLTRKPTMKFSSLKRSLNILLGPGSPFVTSFSRQEYFKSILAKCKINADILAFLKDAVSNFEFVFARELQQRPTAH